MVRRKSVRTRGKLRLSEYFKELKEGDNVAVARERSAVGSFPKRLQGRTGTIKNKRGKAYVVEIKDQSKSKEFLIAPIHLKKITS